MVTHEPSSDGRDARRDAGAWYTPPALVEATLDAALEGVDLTASLRALDPACGDGAFLVALARRIRAACPETADPQAIADVLMGIDLDPEAVEAARVRLAEALPGADVSGCVLHANALIDRSVAPPGWSDPTCPEGHLPATGFDLVVGNPPYIDAARMSRRWPELRAWCAERYTCARGNWDVYCLFIERGLRLVKPGGRLALVVPNALAAARYASATRAFVKAWCGSPDLLDFTTQMAFDAGVYPIGLVATRLSEPAVSSLGAPWPLPAAHDEDLARLADRLPPLSAFADLQGAATVAEAYALAPHLREAEGDLDEVLAAGHHPMVNSGTLDPWQALWGQKTMRYLGQRYLRPVLEPSAVAELSERRQQQLQTPKIIVAGLTRHIEAWPDVEGGWLAGKSTTVVRPREGPLLYWTAVLNSPLATALLRYRFGALAMQGGYLRLGPPQLMELPVPPWGDTQAHQATVLLAQRRAACAAPDPRLDVALADAVETLYRS